MPHDQPNPAHIVDQLAGGDMAPTLLGDLTDEQLADVGRIAVQRHRTAVQQGRDDQEVIGRIAAEYRNRRVSWRKIKAKLAMDSHMTAQRWAQPFLGQEQQTMHIPPYNRADRDPQPKPPVNDPDDWV